jgi:hypothetical protein
MNAYGFASGDRVNFSDPMGLCPPKDRSVEDCGSVQYWKDEAAGSSSMAGRVGNSIMAGFARAAEGALAEATGQAVGDCGVNYACGTAPAVGGTAAGRITGFTKHGINMAISKDGVGVATEAIFDAVRNPQQIIQQARGAMRYVGRNASVVLNDAGEVVTTWAHSSAGWRIRP